jgi:DNA-binding beta-propeller fold protein YncE
MRLLVRQATRCTWLGGMVVLLGLVVAAPASAGEGLYVTNYESASPYTNSVTQYTIGAGGVLTPDAVAGITDPSAPDGIAITPDGQDAYVANDASTGSASISQFTIGSGGELTPDATPSVGGGSGPIVVVVSPNGQYVYTANNGDGTGAAAVSQYTVGAGGELTPDAVPSVVSGPAPVAMAISPNGQYAYVTANSTPASDNPGAVWQLTIGAGGELTPDSTASVAAGNEPNELAITPNGQSLYVTNTGGDVDQYAIGAGGELTPDPTPTVSAGTNPNDVAITPNGEYAYVTNDGGGISQYTIGANGELTPDPTAIVADPNEPTAIAVSPNGQYVYVSNYLTGTLSEFTVGAGGELAPVGTALASGSGPYWIAIAPDPGPAASFTTQVGAASTPTNFTSTSTDADEPIVSESWSFGDGSSATGATVSHTYASPGSYTVTLTVADDACPNAFPFFSGQAGPFTGTGSACSPDTQTTSTQTVNVGAFSILAVKHGARDSIDVTLSVPEAGTVAAIATHETGSLRDAAMLAPGAHRSSYGYTTETVTTAETVTLALEPTAFARRLLTDHWLHGRRQLAIAATFTTPGGFTVLNRATYAWGKRRRRPHGRK